MPEKSVLEMMDESEANRIASEEQQALKVQLREALEAQESRAIKKFGDTLVELTKPNADKRPEIMQARQQAGRPSHSSIGEVLELSDTPYLRLGEPQRKIRNPRTDLLSQLWLQALSMRQWEDMNRYQRQLLDCYRITDHARASLLQGATTPVSGLSGGTGGPFMPLPLSNLVTLARDTAARFRPRCTIFTSDALTLRVPAYGVATADTYAEGAGPAQGEPTTAQVLLSKKKLGVQLRVSIEMMEDSAFNLVSLFTERSGQAIGKEEDVQIATSPGTAPDFTQSVEGATLTTVANTAAMTYAELVNLWYGVPDGEQDDSAWFASSAVLGFLSAAQDLNDRAFFEMSTAPPTVVGDREGMRGTIFGRPVYRAPFAEARLRIGNWRKYGILDGGGIRATASEHSLFSTDLVEFHIFERADGAFLETGAFRENATLITSFVP